MGRGRGFPYAPFLALLLGAVFTCWWVLRDTDVASQHRGLGGGDPVLEAAAGDDYCAPVVVPGASVEHPSPEPELRDYSPTNSVQGRLAIVGTDALSNTTARWSKEFVKHHRQVVISWEGKGSLTAPRALQTGQASIGAMSRPMRDAELEVFRRQFGYVPSQVVVGYDVVAIIVHRDNPLQSVSLAQADAMFGINRRQGHVEEIAKWGQLGLAGDWLGHEIQLFGRNNVSNQSEMFKQQVLLNGGFKSTVREQVGDASVVHEVGRGLFAIGYARTGHLTAAARAVPLKTGNGSAAISPTHGSVVDGTYPLSRQLCLHVLNDPQEGLSELIREFLRFVLSRQGQELATEDGLTPISGRQAAQQLTALQID